MDLNTVKLDWLDPSTLKAPFANGQTYQGVYLLAPLGVGIVEICESILLFIDIAVAHVVAWVDKAGDYGVAKVHRHLEEKKLDHFVLQPTMFMDNFIIIYSESIREKSEIKSDTPNAKIPMISALDIGHFAAKALLNDKNEHNEQRVLGPELITMDQAAKVLSDVLGRRIEHKVVSPEEMVNYYFSRPGLGWTKEFAQFVVMAEAMVDAGSQERLVGLPNTLVGEETFRQWVQRFKYKFESSS
ncbi:hypothetical protein FA13DRAFT_1775134 [Coprinellus micaceus]|uniref:NmrA-like domain-containing protein n=1 Tax=Coprinellus micaceus TaxID=71717 RepID=A0A4Y7T6Q9_COPMI|nr:hypothetical protein FA13DRAFT_1775134 [Coprinellus micaceus]